MLTIRYLTRNKKRSFITICSVTLVTILFLSIGLFFSSIRDYMINDVIKTTGNYHVSLETKNIPKNHIKKIGQKDKKIFIAFDDIKKTYEYTDEICQKNKCKNISYNEQLLSLYGMSKNKNITETLTSLIVVILMILSLGITIIIYNSFSISVIERRKQFSLLKSIGMTKRQIKNMVISESIIILLIGLFMGFIISINATFMVLKIINNLLSLLFSSDLKLTIYPSFVFIPLIFIIIIVFISAFIPAVWASRVPIINSLRNNDDYKYRKCPRLLKRLSITKQLAFYNYKRCKKKYRPIILCIFISVIIYTTFSMYLHYGIKSINKFSNLPNYDYEITMPNSNGQTLLKEFAEKNSTKYNLFNTCDIKGNVTNDSYLKEKYNIKNLIIINGNDDYVINKIKDVYTKDGKMIKLDRKYLKDKVKLYINDNAVEFKTKTKIPFGIDNYLTKDNIVVVTQNIDDYCHNTSLVLLMKGDIDLKKALTQFSKENNIKDISYVDIKKAYMLTNNIITTIKIILYGITILVLLIGISSVINTIWASTNLRAKEFATLKSVGLTKRQMNDMLLYESLYIVIKGFIFSLPVIYFINYLLYKSLTNVLQINQLYPFKELIISFIFLLLIVYLTMLLTHGKFNTKNIVSIITNDNI